MKDSEIMTIMGLIRARYPGNQVVPSMTASEEEIALAVQVWHLSLEGAAIADVMTVLHHWFQTSRFAPDPSELRTKALDLDGRRPRRMEMLRRCLKGDSITPEQLRELRELEAGAPLRDAKALSA